MKTTWVSKNGKQSLNLTSIAYWKYRSKEDAIEVNEKAKESVKDEDEFIYLEEETSTLEVYIGGCGPLIFSDKEADEIYKLLTEEKQIL